MALTGFPFRSTSSGLFRSVMAAASLFVALSAASTPTTSADVVAMAASASPEATAASTSVSRMAGKPLIGAGKRWEYWRASTEPPVAWSFRRAALGWPRGRGPLGYGASGLNTAIEQMTTPALSTYFRTTFKVTDKSVLRRGARFRTIADDGVIVYVNGHEVGRTRVDDIGAAMFSSTWANAAISSTDARETPVTYKVPGQYLRRGVNLVAVQVIANYRSSPDISFQARMTAGKGGRAPKVVRPNRRLTLTWRDEFNGKQLNRDNWTAYNASTFGDAGEQTECLMDRPENLRLARGRLLITARREPTPLVCGTDDTRFPQGRDYSSAHIQSAGKVEFTYGRIEMRAKIPVSQGTSKGLWPAFWLRPADGGLGEIDILEALGSQPGEDWQAGIVHQTLHRDYVGTPSLGYNYQLPRGASMAEGFHTYAVEWSPSKMKFFVDDALTHVVRAKDLSWYREAFTGRNFLIRLNMAVGGTWPGAADSSTRLPATYAIDYVRLYQ